MKMKILPNVNSVTVRWTAIAAALCGFVWQSSVQTTNTLTNGLIAY